MSHPHTSMPVAIVTSVPPTRFDYNNLTFYPLVCILIFCLANLFNIANYKDGKHYILSQVHPIRAQKCKALVTLRHIFS